MQFFARSIFMGCLMMTLVEAECQSRKAKNNEFLIKSINFGNLPLITEESQKKNSKNLMKLYHSTIVFFFVERHLIRKVGWSRASNLPAKNQREWLRKLSQALDPDVNISNESHHREALEKRHRTKGWLLKSKSSGRRKKRKSVFSIRKSQTELFT